MFAQKSVPPSPSRGPLAEKGKREGPPMRRRRFHRGQNPEASGHRASVKGPQMQMRADGFCHARYLLVSELQSYNRLRWSGLHSDCSRACSLSLSLPGLQGSAGRCRRGPRR